VASWSSDGEEFLPGKEEIVSRQVDVGVGTKLGGTERGIGGSMGFPRAKLFRAAPACYSCLCFFCFFCFFTVLLFVEVVCQFVEGQFPGGYGSRMALLSSSCAASSSVAGTHEVSSSDFLPATDKSIRVCISFVVQCWSQETF